jgi:hypothetical protein
LAKSPQQQAISMKSAAKVQLFGEIAKFIGRIFLLSKDFALFVPLFPLLWLSDNTPGTAVRTPVSRQGGRGARRQRCGG